MTLKRPDELDIVIVGGGIAGIVASHMCASRGHNTTLIEAQGRLGGLLCSDKISDGYFDYGCHIASDTGISELDEILFQSFSDSNCNIFSVCRSGSYYADHLNDSSPYIDIRCLPDEIYRKSALEILHEENDDAENLRGHCIRRFGATLYEHVYLPVIEKYLGTGPEHLDKNCINLFDMKRVVTFTDKVTTLLKKDPYFDDLLSFHNPSHGSQKYYPKSGGIGSWVQMLEKQVVDTGVRILKNTKPKNISFDNNSSIVSLTIENDVLTADHLVWALPAPLLLFQSNDTNIEIRRPEFRSAHLFDFAFDREINTECQYINIHEPSMLSGRITLYHNLNPSSPYHSCTVEVVGDVFTDPENAKEIILRELLAIGLIDDTTSCLLKNYRCWNSGFPVMTNEYVSGLEKIERYILDCYPSVTLIGRGNSGAFFMSDVLRKTYENIDERF